MICFILMYKCCSALVDYLTHALAGRQGLRAMLAAPKSYCRPAVHILPQYNAVLSTSRKTQNTAVLSHIYHAKIERVSGGPVVPLGVAYFTIPTSMKTGRTRKGTLNRQNMLRPNCFSQSNSKSYVNRTIQFPIL